MVGVFSKGKGPNRWLTHLPPGLVEAHLNVDTATIESSTQIRFAV
jgi:hypothetical protein